ncbi:MAG: DUF6134 family protein [Bacteroidia bacterium]|nr:DUF6134 family protein [Bacteroidia bacterium]
MNLKSLILMPALLAVSLAAFAQPVRTLQYGVWHGNDEVGSMQVSRREAGGEVIYASESQMRITMLISVDLRFRYEVRFRDGQLQSSMTENYRDGHLKGRSTGRRTASGYEVERDGERFAVNPANIDLCISSLYFQEPRDYTHIFSERWGTYVPVRSLGSGRYELSLPNGDRNTVQYAGGLCRELTVNHSLSSITFRLKN